MSGLLGTKAVYFIYYFPDFEKAYMISVNKLKKMLREETYLFRRSEMAGDGGRVVGYLLNRIDNEERRILTNKQI